MSRAHVEKRRYDSRSRREQAQRRQSRVISTAGTLFSEQGFAATSIREVAEKAAVSQETIYATFGSKAALLMRWLDVQVVGDESPVPFIERPWIDEMRAEPDFERRLALFTRHGTATTSRAAPAMRVLRSAAQSNPQLAKMLVEGQRRRHQDNEALLTILRGKMDIRSGVDDLEAVDWLWAVTSDETYSSLVTEQGWSDEQYERWLALTIRSTLFP